MHTLGRVRVCALNPCSRVCVRVCVRARIYVSTLLVRLERVGGF